MISNPIIDAMLNRKSIRKYKDESPSDEVITSVVRAGQQAPFAAQLSSLLLSRNKEKNPFRAPLLFTICVDCFKLEVIIGKRNWRVATNDLSLLLFGIQDAALMAENLVMAAESVGMGSCFIGHAPYRAEEIIEEYKLPQRVFPLVQLAMGYPAEGPFPRPRYPMEFFLFEDTYPEFDEEKINRAMRQMDEGYLSQNYYRKANYIVDLEGRRKETFTFDNYSWTEHMGRKWGQWHPTPEEILRQLTKCGFDLTKGNREST